MRSASQPDFVPSSSSATQQVKYAMASLQSKRAQVGGAGDDRNGRLFSRLLLTQRFMGVEVSILSFISHGSTLK